MAIFNIQFGEWLPDLPENTPNVVAMARNVIPSVYGYATYPDTSTENTNFSLSAKCKGGIWVKSANTQVVNYIGDSKQLYRTNSVSLVDASRAVGGVYSVGALNFWEFTQWGNRIFAVNGTDTIQEITIGSLNFVDLTGSPPIAQHITSVRDFIVIANISDSARNVYRVRWCAINNPNSWTVDAATLADFQDLPAEGGEIKRIFGGAYGVIFQDRAIWRMVFVGAPLVFQFDQIAYNIGLLAPQAANKHGDSIYFLSKNGFYSFNNGELIPIGKGKVDKFYQATIFKNITAVQTTICAIDPRNHIACWAYTSGNSTVTHNDAMIVYNFAFDKWSYFTDRDFSYILQWGATSGTSLGDVMLAAFGPNNRLMIFNENASGSTTAQIDTSEIQFFPGYLATITSVRPIFGNVYAYRSAGALGSQVFSCDISIVSRRTMGGGDAPANGSLTVTTSVNVNKDGFAQVRSTNRFQRIRFETKDADVSSGVVISGLQVEAVRAGKR